MTEGVEGGRGLEAGELPAVDVAELSAALSLLDPEARRQTLTRCTGREGMAARLLLVEALADGDWRVRAEAIRALSLAHLELEVAERLLGVLQDATDVGFRNAAVDALASGGEVGVQAMARRLPSLNADARKLVADALARTALQQAIAPLSELAGDPDPNVCAAGIEALAQAAESHPERALPALDRAIHRPEPFVRLVALDATRRLGLVLPWTDLAPHLLAPGLTLTALQIASRLDEPRAAQHFVRAMNEKTGQAWLTVVRAFRSYIASSVGNRIAADAALPGLSEESAVALQSASAEPTEAGGSALFVLALQQPLAAGALLPKWLGLDEHWDTVGAVVELLGAAAVPALLLQMQAPAESVAAHALEHLLRLAEQHLLRDDILTRIRGALRDPAPALERVWLGALSNWGNAQDFERAYQRLAHEAQPWLRRALVAVVEAGAARFAADARRLVISADPVSPAAGATAIVIAATRTGITGSIDSDHEFLVRALTNGSAFVRTQAVEALARMPGEASVEAIAFAITDDAPEVQVAAVRALGALSAKGVGAARERLLNIGRSSAQVTLAMGALQALAGCQDAALLPELVQLVAHADSWRAAAAVSVLRGYSPADRLPALRRALAHQDAEVVKRAIELTSVDEHSLGDLRSCLYHSAWAVRRAAADQLGQGGHALANEALHARLAEEKEPLVVEAIHRSLNMLAPARVAAWTTRPNTQELKP